MIKAPSALRATDHPCHFPLSFFSLALATESLALRCVAQLCRNVRQPARLLIPDGLAAGLAAAGRCYAASASEAARC